MTIQGWGLILAFVAVLLALVKPVGLWLFALYEGRRTPLHAVLGPVERRFYRLSGIDPAEEQGWRRYAVHMLLFNIALMLFTYAVLRLQAVLPLNPLHYAGVGADGAFNTAISFTTNTNWQWYAGESTLSNLSQMLALTIHNFTSAATGIALAFALFRGFARRQANGIGNFWADMTRITLYLLLPACIVYTIVLIASGVPQTLAGSVDVTTLEGLRQTLALGPVASQEAIKMLGTNGGGFFNANSAHPFENPGALVNFVQMASIFVIGMGLTWTFGKAVGDTRQGWAILAAMMLLFLAGVGVTYWQEAAGNPVLHHLGVAGGNMEGKEVRFGIAASALFSVVTTAASCGAVNAMHDSFTALGGMIPLINMQLGEVVVGGVGAGIYGFLLFAILAVFVAGLMVGRTPEYVGKKIEAREVKLAVLAIAVLPLVILGGTALSAVAQAGLAGPLNKGPHGFSEILYAFTSAVGNNGSAFAGLTAGTPWYNGLLGVAMWIGRFFVIVPMLAIAGSLAAKRHTPAGAGSFPTTGGLWVGLLVGIILVLGGLTFLPSLALGPIADHLAMIGGQLS
ncbi:potassium-transporting ATPase subunit A [Sphingomonas melonis TY]|jgi:potassium-transporting ATPase potassium-binding subunit|uniref:Potassium-transporting ATPase potassium-binding subunit n=2 Tax=cellular organisms TaxID=131567 RepID=A0A175Y6N0_9SPHN|nr:MULTISPECIES: potassium-transporting ATPase subunit KdpA [Sphingomonas]AOW24951.1 potassium-transporting ATPase subunit KdpA [Sphingomonas melonis TY]KZB96271.1 potassium-transporting ATPase subunit A [Sphingomonas melonis TY]MBI0533372.1 potassium-transporting ATPase subunit KdpA [Sphingomonas sp. TX0522]MBX8845575.1 potassium-transporting ATPase subunit KdpA [Sphingomonas melonis]MBX8854664.1 potassium-transporting ATPase subunit KdpA [Sphingomonas melonis]